MTSTLRWTDVAEDALNASSDWTRSVGGRTTRVINFGLDGIGTGQFGAVVERLALPFDLDLLIVNMLKDDLIRRPVVRGPQAAVKRAEVRDHVRSQVMRRLDWCEPYPEVLAVIAGAAFGLPPHLTLDRVEAAFVRDFYYADADEAISSAQAALETILEHFPDTIFLLDTDYAEHAGLAASRPTARLAAEVFVEITARVPAIRWSTVIAREHMPRSRAGIDAWFNVPADQHKNDVGVRVYGEAVAAFLVERRKSP